MVHSLAGHSAREETYRLTAIQPRGTFTSPPVSPMSVAPPTQILRRIGSAARAAGGSNMSRSSRTMLIVDAAGSGPATVLATRTRSARSGSTDFDRRLDAIRD
jgi:hypothetical protein